MRVDAASVEDKEVMRREPSVAALVADVRQRAALPAAYRCVGIIEADVFEVAMFRRI